MNAYTRFENPPADIGRRIQFQGVASLNGDMGYPFMVAANTGTAYGFGLISPRLRLIVWDMTEDAVIYDNQSGAPVVAPHGRGRRS